MDVALEPGVSAACLTDNSELSHKAWRTAPCLTHYIFAILELRCGFREGRRQESTLYLDETELRLAVPGSTSTYEMGCFLLPDIPLDP